MKVKKQRCRKLAMSSGEVAKLLDISPRTVNKWFDTGLLPGWRIPGSLDRRVPLDAVVRLCREHGVGGKVLQRVLRYCGLAVIVIGDDRIAGELASALGDEWAVLTADDTFAAGVAFSAAGDGLVAVVAYGSAGVHLPDLGQRVRAVNPDAALVVCGPGDLGGDLHADGWRVLATDATAAQVAAAITGEIPHG